MNFGVKLETQMTKEEITEMVDDVLRGGNNN